MRTRAELLSNSSILSVIGNTPMIRLNRVFQNIHFSLFAKLEGLNPGGSIKDRAALSLIKHGIQTGDIDWDTVIIESSSGNMGIGLAQACMFFRLRFICVVDKKTTQQNIAILKAYGAEIDIVSKPDPITGEFLPARIERVKEILKLHKNSFWTNQYANEFNSIAHHQTMHEIVASLEGKVDYLFCATSTCGTLRGCMEYVRKNNLSTKIYAVDALGSVIFGNKKGKRLIPGHGAGIIHSLYNPDLAEECIYVSDLDCVIGCRRLVREEAILVGGSSGGVLIAIDKIKHRIPKESNCVAIFPDRGERYLNTIYSDIWVKENLGKDLHCFESNQPAISSKRSGGVEERSRRDPLRGT